MDELRHILGEDRVTTRIVDRLAFAHDASLYRLVPTAIVRPASTEHVRALFAWCAANRNHLTFRTAGTSLSGQAVTSGVLVDLSRDWKSISILDDGKRVLMQPGITGAKVNAQLRRYGRKLGPDPASIIAAMIGGIVANNASGMCCGTAQNSYNTLDAMCYLLADGTLVDTSHADADARLYSESRNIHSEIASIRDFVRANAELTATIRRKYSIKNTIGYSLNAFLDETEPARIIARLLIGSEGTLGFIENVTLNTVPDAVVKHTALVIYASIDEACATVPYWRENHAAAVELMDEAALRSFAHLSSTPRHLRSTKQGTAALLVEFHDQEPPMDTADIVWTTQPSEQAVLWRLRKGLMPTIGAMRPSGSTMINEDIAVPPQYLASLVKDVRKAFNEFGFYDGIIFGHAKDGNIHFVVHQSFNSEHELDRYAQFMDRIAEIVVDRYGGSLKAEHGTGRNMTPYVEKEWGSVAYEVMHRVKEILDPKNILSPDVVLNGDPLAHIKNIKPVPPMPQHAEVDLCIECGFCEHVCPSKGLTLTPRQRIVLQRERVINRGDKSVVRAIDAAFVYDGIETCATDGICATVCPVGIDTGQMVKNMRSTRTSALGRSMARALASNMRFVNSVSWIATSLIRRYGRSSIQRPRLAREPHVIYVQTCPSKWVGKTKDELSLGDVIVTLAERAGLALHILDSRSVCCGQPFSSHGYTDAAELLSDQLLQTLVNEVGGRQIPVFLDTSTCAFAILQKAETLGLDIIDQTKFAELILQRIGVVNPVPNVVIHPGCGTEKLHATQALVNIVQACATEFDLPPSAACCGMAGDRGLRHPELVASALRDEIQEIRWDATLGVSCNVMCEYALHAQSGVKFLSVLHVVERATRY